MKESITGRVVFISEDAFSVVINKGTLDGVCDGMRFLIYKIGDELFDPITNKSLGRLEIVCGEGVVTHAQEMMSTIQSSTVEILHKKTIRRPGYSFIFQQPQEIDEPTERKLPFKDVEKNCFARMILNQDK